MFLCICRYIFGPFLQIHFFSSSHFPRKFLILIHLFSSREFIFWIPYSSRKKCSLNVSVVFFVKRSNQKYSMLHQLNSFYVHKFGMIVVTNMYIFRLLSFIFYFLFCRNANKKNRDYPWEIYTLKELLRATNNFHQDNKIGEGGFGSVYWGRTSKGIEAIIYI